MTNVAYFFRFLFFVLLYVVCGTLLHESCHILVARMLGYHTVLHYGSMDWLLPSGQAGTNAADSCYITLGPLLTADLGSIIALVILLLYGQRMRPWLYWTLIFIAMLIFRHIALPAISLAMHLMGQASLSYGRDEAEIANCMGWPEMAVGLPLLLLAITSLVCLYIWILDRRIRVAFIVAGAVGCPLGYVLWLYWLGPQLLP